MREGGKFKRLALTLTIASAAPREESRARRMPGGEGERQERGCPGVLWVPGHVYPGAHHHGRWDRSCSRAGMRASRASWKKQRSFGLSLSLQKMWFREPRKGQAPLHRWHELTAGCLAER